MSTLELENIKHPDNSGNNIELAADGSVGNLNLSGNMGIGTNSPLSSPAGAFAWANPIATIEGSRPTLYLNSSGSLATIRMWPSGTDGSSTTLDDFHINAIATSGSTPGSLVFAAQGGALGAGLSINSNNIVTTPDQPGFRVYRSTAQTLSASTAVVVQLDTKLYDNGNNFDTSTHRFTAPVTGMYMFTGHILFDTSATLHRGQANLLKNGSRLSATQIALGGYNHCGGVFSSLGKLNAGDYIELQGKSETHGGSFYGSSDWTYLSGYLIG